MANKRIIKKNIGTGIRCVGISTKQKKKLRESMNESVRSREMIDALQKKLSEHMFYTCGSVTYEKSILDTFKNIPKKVNDLKKKYPELEETYINDLTSEEQWDEWNCFVKQYQSILKPTDDKIKAFESVIACIMARKHELHSQIRNIYMKYYDLAFKYRNNTLCLRKNIGYDLSIEEFQHYRMLYCLYLAADENPQILTDIRNNYTGRFPEVYAYAKFLCKHMPEGKNINLCLSPIVKVYMMCVKNGLYAERSLETILLLNEFFSLEKGAEERDGIEMLCHVYLMAFYQDPHFIPKKTISYMYSEILDDLKYVRKKDLSDLLVTDSVELVMSIASMKSNGTLTNGIKGKGVWYFIDAKKEERDQILNCFFTRDYIKTFLSKGTSVEDYIEQVIKNTDQCYLNIVDPEQKNKAEDKNEFIRNFTEAMELWESFLLYVNSYMEIKDRTLNDKDIELSLEERSDETEDDAYNRACATIEVLKKELSELKMRENNEKALNAALSSARKENENLKQLLNEEKENRRELIGLRNYIYENSEDDEYGPMISPSMIDDLAAFLNKNVRGVVLGGHVNFHNRLSEYLPDWRFFPIRKAVSKEILDNTDVLVIYTKHIDHASYLTTLANLKKTDCKLLYVNNVHMEYVIKKIYDFAKVERG